MMSEMVDDIETEILEKELAVATVEAFHAQSQIIDLLNSAVNDLVSLVIQHRDVDDAAFAPIKEKIDEAATIRAELNL